MKETRFQQLSQYPEYHPLYPLICEPLSVLMVWILLSHGVYFTSPLNPPDHANYDWNIGSLKLATCSNLLWLLIIDPNQSTNPLLYLPSLSTPDCFISVVIEWRMIRYGCYILLLISSAIDKFHPPSSPDPPHYTCLIYSYYSIMNNLSEAWQDENIPWNPLVLLWGG